MPTGYPEDFDTFIEPTLPEETTLSSSGTGDRNHVEHHRDMGDAIEALQRGAAYRDHDHGGDPDDIRHGRKLDQANTHENADTDTVEGIHHTLGEGAGQAAPGNHTHDYAGPSIINKALEICTSSSRPPNPNPGKLIWEVDTNRMRVWAQFPGERQAVQGLYSIDKLERTSSVDLGPTLWDQWYQFPTGKGVMATPSGHSASWIKASADANRCIARRIFPADRYTQSYDQVITFTTNDHVADWTNPSADNPATNDAYFRMSDDGQSYVRAALTWWKGSTGAIMLTYTTTGPTGEVLIGQLPAQTNAANIMWQLRLVGNKFEVYRGVEHIGSILDNEGVTTLPYKGWGFGMQAGDGGSQQSLPNEISEVGIADATYYTSNAAWQLLTAGDIPRVGLGAARAQPINPTGTMIEWTEIGEDNFDMFKLENPTHVVIKEAGIYHVHASVAWATQLRGDRAATIITVNDQPTPHMHWEFVRGQNYVPGFSQTVDVTAFLRLKEGDRVGVAAAHNGPVPQHTGAKKNAEITQVSRFFLCFQSP
ncbi:gp117 [Mycobacterium phage Bxz1]|uniref:DUF7257 domain-containing protein n=2 Tax=Bixzunavirus Bxz1 TaxID=2006134 RepID=Q853G4_BPMBZ|nr:gp117 [Mycobacterium phage Bxz1]AAN16773.1 hypothetical protein PBI_BXZ1_117 [Mycobacterium phage Bxz1]AOZ63470.1 hypothetical protein SEA_GABRIEL_120 [Mycobacterium phage Gabriel]AZF97814.1 hypothetical protein SEA_BURROUGH_120 [Mycobacterium phage Burrough]